MNNILKEEYFRYVNMSQEDGEVYLNILKELKEFNNSEIVQCNFQQYDKYLTVNGLCYSKPYNKTFKGNIIGDGEIFHVMLEITRLNCQIHKTYLSFEDVLGSSKLTKKR